MELALQFGYGMMEHSRALISQWGGGTAILSPRDLTDAQLRKLAEDIVRLPNGEVMIDPQFYLPHADHDRLVSHAYWPRDYDTNVFWQGPALARLLDELISLNRSIGVRRILLPGMLAQRVDADWVAAHEQIVGEAVGRRADEEHFATIALSSDALRNADQVAEVIEAAANFDVTGFYVVPEHPNGSYLVDDPNWLANVLDLCAGLRLTRRRVILGYCNHQMLIAAAAKVDAIASGTWMNVRSFPPDKFRTLYDDEIKQRAIWYYCPQALSEYKIPFLDIAHRLSLLPSMRASGGVAGAYADVLFSGAQPSSVGFTEQAAFRHYLQCLRSQAAGASAGSFDETVARHEAILDQAEDTIRTLSAAGIKGQLRDFRDVVDVNRAALGLFVSLRGPILRRAWSQL